MTDAERAERSHRRAEEQLDAFQLGLQRRLESGLRINTFILAGAAVISIAFVFNATIMLENAFNAEAMDQLIRDISDQTTALKLRTDAVVGSVEKLGQNASRQADLLANLAANDGDLTVLRDDARRLARSLRRSRTDQTQAGETLRSIGTDAKTLAGELSGELDLLQQAGAEGGDLRDVHVNARTLADALQDDAATLTRAPIDELSRSAQQLARRLDDQQRAADHWSDSEANLSKLGARSSLLARRLEIEEKRLSQLAEANEGVLKQARGLAKELGSLRQELARERRALKQPPAGSTTPSAPTPPDPTPAIEIP